MILVAVDVMGFGVVEEEVDSVDGGVVTPGVVITTVAEVVPNVTAEVGVGCDTDVVSEVPIVVCDALVVVSLGPVVVLAELVSVEEVVVS
jgi:hypothetical protein